MARPVGPVCVTCNREMFPEKNGVRAVLHASFGPYEVYVADLWECLKCGVQVLVGFGRGPLAQHFEPEFAKVSAGAEYWWL